MKYALATLLMLVSPLARAEAIINLKNIGSSLMWLVGWGLILYVLWWGLNKINPADPWKTIGKAAYDYR